MAAFISTQVTYQLPGLGRTLVVTTVKLNLTTDTVTLPRMAATTNSVVQLRRPGDTSVTVSQTSASVVTLTGSIGQSALLVSIHDDPIPSPVGDGA